MFILFTGTSTFQFHDDDDDDDDGCFSGDIGRSNLAKSTPALGTCCHPSERE
jgi:hypothetical protein